MSMTSRERVLTTLKFQEPDRVPIVLGVSNATGIKMRPYQRLKELLGIQAPDKYVYDWPELGTALPDEATMQRLHSDVRGVLDRLPKAVFERNLNRPEHADCIDDWGTGQKEIEPGIWYPGIHPMADASTIEDIENYPNWPDMDDPYRVSHVAEETRKLAEENQYAIMGTPWLLFPFERAFALQGMDKFLLNMAMNPDFSIALLRKNLELCKTLMGHVLDAAGDNLDIIKIGDDLGTQE
ncbi:MAG: hypothetical protein RBT34_07475, partial [Anaerolineaceae bacterium]|nr:hypothetical protein [Anaerolineaceae bacterium]